MPIYEYRCSSCGHELESLQKLSDAPLVACPSCKADALVKLMSAAGFHLKGSGWYATDFKGSGKPASNKPDAESKSDSKSDSESKSDTVTADKAGDKAPVAEKSGDKAATPEKSGDKPSTPAPTPAGGTAA